MCGTCMDARGSRPRNSWRAPIADDGGTHRLGRVERSRTDLLNEGGTVTGGRRILVLGGGVGGLVVANALRKRLPQRHEIVLVSRDDTFVFAPSLLWVMVGARRAEQISRPLRRLTHRGVTLPDRRDRAHRPGGPQIEVGGGDARRRRARDRARRGDRTRLIRARRRRSRPLYSLAGALVFRDQLASLRGGRIVVLTARRRPTGPAAPYEAAMLTVGGVPEAGHGFAGPHVHGRAGTDGSGRPRGLRGGAGDGGVEGYRVPALPPGDPGRRRDPHAALLEWRHGELGPEFVPPHLAPAVVTRSGLGDASGWIPGGSRDARDPVPERVRRRRRHLTIPLALGKPLPKAGVFAHLEGEVVARNIVRRSPAAEARSALPRSRRVLHRNRGRKAGFGKGNLLRRAAPRRRASTRPRAAGTPARCCWNRRGCGAGCSAPRPHARAARGTAGVGAALPSTGPISLSFPVQVPLADTEDLRRALAVALALLQHALDVAALDLVQRDQLAVLFVAAERGLEAHAERQVLGLDAAAVAEDERALDHVLQLRTLPGQP